LSAPPRVIVFSCYPQIFNLGKDAGFQAVIVDVRALLLKFGKSSFLRIPDQGPGQAQESSLFETFWIPAYAGMTKWGYFSKRSM
jgi:hypothetical protein